MRASEKLHMSTSCVYVTTSHMPVIGRAGTPFLRRSESPPSAMFQAVSQHLTIALDPLASTSILLPVQILRSNWNLLQVLTQLAPCRTLADVLHMLPDYNFLHV